jgi:alcohol dehydrogenase
MNFFLPTKIYIEKDCVQNHSKELSSFGKKALIVTGAHSSRLNGSLSDVENVLKQAYISYQIFDQIEENPSVESVGKAAETGKNFNSDFVIGIGGGSPLDAAKAVALLIANPDLTSDDLYTNKAVSHLPVVAIPTTCGTGSEATGVSVLTNHKQGIKKSIPNKIFPALALVDGKYLSSSKKEIIINTAIDALAHLIESYLNSKANDMNKMFSEYGLKLWGQNKDNLLSDQTFSPDLLQKLMLTSTIAGVSIAHTGTGLPHGMSYDLTYSFGIPHGKACGYFQAAYLEVCQKHLPDEINKILELLQIATIAEFQEMVEKMIGRYKLSRSDAEKFADAISHNEGKLSATPFKISQEEIFQIYEKSVL